MSYCFESVTYVLLCCALRPSAPVLFVCTGAQDMTELFVFVHGSNYGSSQRRLLLSSACRLKTLCLVCGLPGAMSSVIHTGCVCCLCILYQQSICTLSPTAHSALCTDSNSRALFFLAMSLRSNQRGFERTALCLQPDLRLVSIYDRSFVLVSGPP